MPCVCECVDECGSAAVIGDFVVFSTNSTELRSILKAKEIK